MVDSPYFVACSPGVFHGWRLALSGDEATAVACRASPHETVTFRDLRSSVVAAGFNGWVFTGKS